ncbi:MarR family transcriptional regulator [Halobacterium salinarum]|uniref:MarR family transcriptional regulator n=1 Tax=Halobacterium salinarum TaxID=2242 RepID=UPI00255621A7|nr:helix-turn-helix domain-containing protein [Halobacterium salinarum]MDL0127047.1 helix-turn-helix domain-containing protein [Halobacterium salinarum]
MVNESFTPNDEQEQLLDVLKQGRAEGSPWGYATVSRFSEETGIRKQYVNRHLDGLLGAGWVTKDYHGLYRFVDDPREDAPTTPTLGVDELRDALADAQRAEANLNRDNLEDALDRMEELLAGGG